MPAVTDWRMSHHEDFLQQGQITPGDVVGAYGFNTLAACPSLGGQYFPLNMAPCLALSSSVRHGVRTHCHPEAGPATIAAEQLVVF